MPPITNNMFENVLLVFARIGKLMCTYINKCINKLKKIFSYKFEPAYVCVCMFFVLFCFLFYKRLNMVNTTNC